MENFGSMLKSALFVVVLVAVVQSGSAAEKLANCCKKVNSQEITEPILGYLVQRANLPCVNAIIFQTASGYYCSQVGAPWVRPKVVAFEEAKARDAALSAMPTPSPSLLSIITSKASPTPSSSSLSPSSSSLSPSSSSSSLSPSSSSLPPSSSARPSFPSTSETPAGETLPEMDYE